MDPREELRELILQAAEHVRYYRELGLTHIGEQKNPQPVPEIEMVISAPVAPLITIIPEVPGEVAASHVASLKSEAMKFPTPIRSPQSEPTPTMPTKKEAPSLFDAPSLFGDPAPHPSESKPIRETIEEIRADLGACKRCKLWSTRTNIVFGEGNPNAELMFVGEGPGADEDASGRPFVGRAGQLLTKMIEAINYKREDVYIANVVKSRPPGNRNPEADEVKACSPFLFRQIAAIRPKLIVTLGNPATQALLDTKVGITRLRGELQDYPGDPHIKVIPTFHPAYLLRSPDKKREAWEDLKKVRAFLRGES